MTSKKARESTLKAMIDLSGARTKTEKEFVAKMEQVARTAVFSSAKGREPQHYVQLLMDGSHALKTFGFKPILKTMSPTQLVLDNPETVHHKISRYLKKTGKADNEHLIRHENSGTDIRRRRIEILRRNPEDEWKKSASSTEPICPNVPRYAWDSSQHPGFAHLELQQKLERVLGDENINAAFGGIERIDTDKFCGRCKTKTRCTKYSMQTRSADEPSTIFVTCTRCKVTRKEGG